jgi:hypothetical protein
MAFGRGGKNKKATTIPATKQARCEKDAERNRKRRKTREPSDVDDVVSLAAVDSMDEARSGQ